MTKLSVNLNAVAQLRNRRDLPWPSVTGMARIVLDAGAVGVTVHPRPDERHIRRSDVFDLVNLLRTDYPHAEFNIEGYPTPDFLELIAAANPHQVTLVPDAPEQATSDHGWDFIAHKALLTEVVAELAAPGRRIAMFCDPDASGEALEAAKAEASSALESAKAEAMTVREVALEAALAAAAAEKAAAVSAAEERLDATVQALEAKAAKAEKAAALAEKKAAEAKMKEEFDAKVRLKRQNTFVA